jgi:tRNA(fMet)-specific endonuclease VapC
MFLLDSDHMSLLERAESPEGSRLRARLQGIPTHERTTTIVSFEEQARGWLAYLSKASSIGHQIEAYRRLKRQLDTYCAMAIVTFDEHAAAEFQRLRQARLRIGTMDLKIAAIVLSHDATLLSRNLVDFRKVPGPKVEDWTI